MKYKPKQSRRLGLPYTAEEDRRLLEAGYSVRLLRELADELGRTHVALAGRLRILRRRVPK